MRRNSSFLHFLKNRELNELYICVALRSFSTSMIGIFIPIYLWTIGLSFSSIFIFYAIISLFHAISVFFAGRFSSKFGFKHTIFFSIPFLILFYFLIYFASTSLLLLFSLAVIYGLQSGFFWLSFHSDFSLFSKRNERCKSTSFTKLLIKLFNVAGPAIGGLIIVLFSYEFLFIFVACLLLFSAIPLFFSKDSRPRISFSLKHVFLDQKIKDFFSLIGYGIEIGAGQVLWPLFIFGILGYSVASLGFVATISLLCSLGAIFLIGVFSGKNRLAVLKVGALFNSALWFVKIFVSTVFQIFLVHGFYGILRPMITIPFDSINYDTANKTNILEYITFREFVYHSGRVFFFVAMAFILNLKIGFAIAAVASVLYLLIR